MDLIKMESGTFESFSSCYHQSDRCYQDIAMSYTPISMESTFYDGNFGKDFFSLNNSYCNIIRINPQTNSADNDQTHFPFFCDQVDLVSDSCTSPFSLMPSNQVTDDFRHHRPNYRDENVSLKTQTHFKKNAAKLRRTSTHLDTTHNDEKLPQQKRDEQQHHNNNSAVEALESTLSDYSVGES